MKAAYYRTKETKGAHMFTELNDEGNEVPTVSDGKVSGQIYLRKESAIGKSGHAYLTVEVVSYPDKASAMAAAKNGLSGKLKAA